MITSKDIRETMDKKNIKVMDICHDTGIDSHAMYDIYNNKRKIENMGFEKAMRIIKYIYTPKEILETILLK